MAKNKTHFTVQCIKPVLNQPSQLILHQVGMLFALLVRELNCSPYFGAKMIR